MNKTSKFSAEVPGRAVRLVFECREEHPSQWAAVVSIATKIGCKPQTLLGWVRQHEKDTGQRDGATTAERERVKVFALRSKLYIKALQGSFAELQRLAA